MFKGLSFKLLRFQITRSCRPGRASNNFKNRLWQGDYLAGPSSTDIENGMIRFVLTMSIQRCNVYSWENCLKEMPLDTKLGHLGGRVQTLGRHGAPGWNIDDRLIYLELEFYNEHFAV